MFLINKCVRSGAYHTAIRELRFVFESFIHAYYIDKEHPDSKMVCKLEIIKEIEKMLFGSKLIEKTDLKSKEKLKSLYSRLSKCIHSSYEELSAGKSDQPFLSAYDKELFDKCYIFKNEVMDAIIFILISFDNEIIDKIQRNKRTMDFLNESNCELCLSLLKNK